MSDSPTISDVWPYEQHCSRQLLSGYPQRSSQPAVSCRYEIGRHSAQQWALWNDNLRRIASNPRNIVAANNMYDLEYIK
jgi:hypothetical protein